jgi:hypothetical protein
MNKEKYQSHVTIESPSAIRWAKPNTRTSKGDRSAPATEVTVANVVMIPSRPP